MAVRVEPIVLLVSVVFHAALGVAVVRVEPREAPPPPPIVITMQETDRPDRPKPDEPEPEPSDQPDTSEPDLPDPDLPDPPAEPKPQPVQPRPPAPTEPAKAEPAPASSAPPEFGLELGGDAGPGGLAVPRGDPAGKPGGGGGGPAKVAAQTRKLSSPEPAETKSGCKEEPTKPKPTKLDRPTYTEAARAAAIEGAVRLRLSIAADGTVDTVEVLQSLDPELDQRAVAAAKAASFEPARRCGEPVAASLTMSIRYSL